MTERRLNKILAVFFVVVGILAMVNTYRLHDYIADTLPRDRAQEECQSQTIDVLKFLLGVRIERDDTLYARDDATIAVLDRLAAGQKPTPEEIDVWRDAITADSKIRQKATNELEQHPIPDCPL